MARVVKEKEYALRQNEILDAAQRFVYTKGYEQMSIQDILDTLRISKGAFYHYFGSKQVLLEALIERMLQQAEKILLPVVEDPELPALEKLDRYFATAARWKTAQKEFFLGLLRVWYADDNAVVRQKVTSTGLKRITPPLAAIIRQGIEEGVLSTPHPDQVASVAFSLLQSVGDSVAEMLLSQESNGDTLKQIEAAVAAYTDALERVLGAPAGSLCVMDVDMLKEWVDSRQGESTTASHA